MWYFYILLILLIICNDNFYFYMLKTRENVVLILEIKHIDLNINHYLLLYMKVMNQIVVKVRITFLPKEVNNQLL